MKNLIRFLALILCLCQLVCLFGCTEDTAPVTQPSETEQQMQDTQDTEPEEDPTWPDEVSKVIPWGADGPIQEQAVASGEMIICFMSGEGTKISGGDSATAYSETKWGDSSLIVFPNGEVMLIDGGMSDYAPLLVENLQSLGITKIDYVVLSHRHNDHYGGLLCRNGVLESFEIGVVYTSGVYHGDTSDPMKLESLCKKLDIPHEVLRQGEVRNIGDVTMEVLWPKPELIGTYADTTESINSTSLVLRFDYKDVSALFTGDLYVSGEKEMLASIDPAKLDVDILKIPHHGRSTWH